MDVEVKINPTPISPYQAKNIARCARRFMYGNTKMTLPYAVLKAIGNRCPHTKEITDQVRSELLKLRQLRAQPDEKLVLI